MALDFPANPIDGQVYGNFYYSSAKSAWRTTTEFNTPSTLVNAVITDNSATAVPLTVRGFASQSANLQEWKNSSGTTLSSISSTGSLALASPLSVTNGGTGTTTLNSGGYLKGAGTSAVTAQTGIPATDITGTLNSLRLPAGTVVGFNFVRTSARTTYAYNNDVIIGALNIPITPKYANSLLLVQWHVNYEADYNGVFRVFRDGGLIYNTGYQGYNENDGNSWSGVSALIYDTNTASTPTSQMIQYFTPAFSTSATTLQLAVRSSVNANNTFYLNRSVESAGALALEVTVSTAVIWEIAQ